MNNNNDGEEYQRDIWDRVPLVDFLQPEKEFGIDVVERMPSPRIFKSHLPVWSLEKKIMETQCKAIYIARNPKDTLVSYYHMIKLMFPEIMTDWSLFFDLFRKDQLVYGNWFDHVIAWHKNIDKDNFLFLKYEDMKADRSKSIQTIASFLDIPVTQELLHSIVERTGFKKMKENPHTNMESSSKLFVTEKVAFIRKGQVGDWKNYFTVEQNEYMDTLIEERLKDTGVEFDYI